MKYVKFCNNDYFYLNREIFNDEIFIRNARRFTLFMFLHEKINQSDEGRYVATYLDMQKKCGGRIPNIKNDLKIFEEQGFFKVENLYDKLLITLASPENKKAEVII